MAKMFIVLRKIWLWLAGALVLLGYASIWWFEGFGELQEAVSPFNVWNVIAVLVTIAPGLGLLKLGEYLRDRRSAAKT
jgi:hypothetical protein